MPHPWWDWPPEPSLGTWEVRSLGSWCVSVTHTVVLYFPQVSMTEFSGDRKQMPAATRDSLTHVKGIGSYPQAFLES